MTDTRKVMQQALEALELARRSYGTMLLSDPPQEAWKANRVDSALLNAIKAMREALAQQGEQQPVAWMNEKRDMTYIYGPYNPDDIPLYAGAAPAAQPPQKHIWCLGSKTTTMAFWSEDAARKAQAGFPASMHFELYRVDLLDAAPAAQQSWSNRAKELLEIFDGETPAAQPLSDEVIDELSQNLAADDWAHDFTRRIERMHGIGADK